jgi:hypothetical protein
LSDQQRARLVDAAITSRAGSVSFNLFAGLRAGLAHLSEPQHGALVDAAISAWGDRRAEAGRLSAPQTGSGGSILLNFPLESDRLALPPLPSH